MTDEQIIELFGTVPYFADTTITPMDCERLKEPFRSSMRWSISGSVNIYQIVGTMHPDYAGLTWRELLTKGRRMHSNIEAYRNNPGYYTELYTSRNPSMYFSICDGKGYVTEDGNHRTCIGRFFLYTQKSPYIHGVHVHEKQTDIRTMSLFYRLKSILPEHCLITPLSQEISREDGDGWAIHSFENSISIENRRRRGFSATFKAVEIEEGLLPEFYHPLKRRFGTYRNVFN